MTGHQLPPAASLPTTFTMITGDTEPPEPEPEPEPGHTHITQMLAFNPGHQKTIVPDVSCPAGPPHHQHHGDGHFSAPRHPPLSGDS